VEEALARLWQRACEHAELRPDVDVRLIPLEGSPEERGGPVGSWSRTHLGGVPGPEDRWRFTPAEVDRFRENPYMPAVVVFTGTDEAALLGLIRYTLEQIRHATQQTATFRFAIAASDALVPLYQPKGRGSAVVYGAQPLMRSANAHAAALVTAVFGPQIGRLRDPAFGPLFRVDNEPESPERLPRRAVVYAAIHAQAVTEKLGGAEALEHELLEVDVDAPAWWQMLAADDLFQALGTAAPAFVPAPEEIAVYGEAAGEAWRPLEGLLDRAYRYGMGLTEPD